MGAGFIVGFEFGAAVETGEAMSDKLPKEAWALLYGDQLAVTDYRLPIFWEEFGAEKYNTKHLRGRGRLVRVMVLEVVDGEK